MKKTMPKIARLLTQWWNEEAADQKTQRTDEVSERAHLVASDAQYVIASYRSASRVAQNERMTKTE